MSVNCNPSRLAMCLTLSTHQQQRPHNPPADDRPQQHGPGHNMRHQEAAADVLLHEVKPPRPLRCSQAKGGPAGEATARSRPLEQPGSGGAVRDMADMCVTWQKCDMAKYVTWQNTLQGSVCWGVQSNTVTVHHDIRTVCLAAAQQKQEPTNVCEELVTRCAGARQIRPLCVCVCLTCTAAAVTAQSRHMRIGRCSCRYCRCEPDGFRMLLQPGGGQLTPPLPVEVLPVVVHLCVLPQ